MTNYVVIRGIKFEVLGPVDRRLSAPISKHGRIGCPYCAQSTETYGKHIGPFYVNKYYFEHLKRDHFKCECGWVGIVPGQHLTRSLNHGSGVPNMGGRREVKAQSVRVSDLSFHMGSRIKDIPGL